MKHSTFKSTIVVNNPVKKNMDKFHKPKTHRDKTKYKRKTNERPRPSTY